MYERKEIIDLFLYLYVHLYQGGVACWVIATAGSINRLTTNVHALVVIMKLPPCKQLTMEMQVINPRYKTLGKLEKIIYKQCKRCNGFIRALICKDVLEHLGYVCDLVTVVVYV